MTKRYIKLSNAAVIDLDLIQVIVRKDINQYVVVLNNCPVSINADGNDVDALEATMEGLIVVEKAPEILKTKLEVSGD